MEGMEGMAGIAGMEGRDGGGGGWLINVIVVGIIHKTVTNYIY